MTAQIIQLNIADRQAMHKGRIAFRKHQHHCPYPERTGNRREWCRGYQLESYQSMKRRIKGPSIRKLIDNGLLTDYKIQDK